MVAIVATATLCAGWSASALSATTTEIECDSVIRDLKRLEVSVEALSVRRVDHVSIGPDPSGIELLHVQDASSETVAPFLYLTPRVATLLRDIFDATREIRDQDGFREISSSPIAEYDRVSEILEILDDADPAAPANDEIDLPLFQQRMFRTDI
jgi:hypothetical protein